MTVSAATGELPTARPGDMQTALRNLQLGFFITHMPYDRRDK